MTAKFSLTRGLELTLGLLHFLIQLVPANTVWGHLVFMNGAYNLADGPHDSTTRAFCLGTLTHQENQGPSGVSRTSQSIDLLDRNPQT